MAPNERQELMTMILQLQTQVVQLSANANGCSIIANMNNAHTPKHKSIATPDTPDRDGYKEVINFNDSKSAKIVQ